AGVGSQLPVWGSFVHLTQVSKSMSKPLPEPVSNSGSSRTQSFCTSAVIVPPRLGIPAGLAGATAGLVAAGAAGCAAVDLVGSAGDGFAASAAFASAGFGSGGLGAAGGVAATSRRVQAAPASARTPVAMKARRRILRDTSFLLEAWDTSSRRGYGTTRDCGRLAYRRHWGKARNGPVRGSAPPG